MVFFKTCSAVLALVLAFQAGCNLFCHHVEGAVTSEGSPPCHTRNEHGEQPAQPAHDHGTTEDCHHPQAIADKHVQLKTAAVDSVAVLAPAALFVFQQAHAFESHSALPRAFMPSGPPLLMLRI